MHLYEFEAKQWLTKYGLAMQIGDTAYSQSEARQIAETLKYEGIKNQVLKAQVLSGGRKKAGGIIMTDDPSEIERAAQKLIGNYLYTEQTGSEGAPIRAVSIAEQMEVMDEYYVAFVQDRHSETGIEVMVSRQGGSDVEQKGTKDMMTLPVKVQDYLDKDIADQIVDFLKIDQIHGRYGFVRKDALEQLQKLYKAFIQMDCTLLEVNPWALVRSLEDDHEPYMTVLDCKITIDENAIYRQPEIVKERLIIDAKMKTAPSPETMAYEKGIQYVDIKHGGNIGCIVNGAGLAMATMDLIKFKEGVPANFMDISGKVGREQIEFAFQLLAHNHDIEVIFLNIFGGIVDCELVAQGLIDAITHINENKYRHLRRTQLSQALRRQGLMRET